MTACKTTYGFSLSLFPANEAIRFNPEDLTEWLTTHCGEYKWYTTYIIDPRTFDATITVMIEDELLAMHFKLAWSDYLKTN
jgi:hypothetical protein